MSRLVDLWVWALTWAWRRKATRGGRAGGYLESGGRLYTGIGAEAYEPDVGWRPSCMHCIAAHHGLLAVVRSKWGSR